MSGAVARRARRARVLTGTPAEHGFSFPAEWRPHAATWISWPRPEGISFPGYYHRAIHDFIWSHFQFEFAVNCTRRQKYVDPWIR